MLRPSRLRRRHPNVAPRLRKSGLRIDGSGAVNATSASAYRADLWPRRAVDSVGAGVTRQRESGWAEENRDKCFGTAALVAHLGVTVTADQSRQVWAVAERLRKDLEAL